jgi:hypothetical protein
MNGPTIFVLCLIVLLSTAKSTLGSQCGPVCAIYCEYGNVLDSKGCPTCSCKKTACENDQAPLENYRCISNFIGHDCPAGYSCNDAYAVCCPRTK